MQFTVHQDTDNDPIGMGISRATIEEVTPLLAAFLWEDEGLEFETVPRIESQETDLL